MARNRNNNTADFLKTFQTTYGLARGAMKDYDMAGIAKATPEESQGFTKEDGQQLEAIANAKKEDGTPYYSVTADDKGGYQVGSNFEIQNADVVTPAPAELGSRGVASRTLGAKVTPEPFTFAQRGVTDFLGKRQSGTMTDAQVLGARQNAMAGVMEKYGDATGAMQYRQQAQQGVRQEVADARSAEQHDWAKQAQAGIAQQRVREDEERSFTRGMETDTAGWFDKRLTGADGARREATLDDHLAGKQFQAAKYMEAGKTELAGKAIQEYQAAAFGKINLQTKERDEALVQTAAALSSGNLNAVKDFYNKFIPDGGHVTEITKDAAGAITIHRVSADGRAIAPTVMKDASQMAAALSTFKDPMAVYNWSQQEFARNLQTKADKRGDAQLGLSQAAGGRAQAEFAAGGSERQLKSTVATLQLGLANTDDPVQQQAIQAKLAAIQSGLGGDKNAPSEVKLASALVKAGLAPDMRSALGMALNRKSDSPDERHQDYVATGLKNMNSAAQAVKAADEVMTQMGFAKKNGRWTQDGATGSLAGKDITTDPKAIAIMNDKNQSPGQKKAKLIALGYE